MTKKWITYGVAGALGLGIVAGGAVAAAQALDLRTSSGVPIDGERALTARDGGALAAPTFWNGTSVTVASPASPDVTSAASVHTPASATSAESAPVSVGGTAPAPGVDSVASAPSPVSVASPASAPSPASPVSAVSADSP